MLRLQVPTRFDMNWVLVLLDTTSRPRLMQLVKLYRIKLWNPVGVGASGALEIVFHKDTHFTAVKDVREAFKTHGVLTEIARYAE